MSDTSCDLFFGFFVLFFIFHVYLDSKIDCLVKKYCSFPYEVAVLDHGRAACFVIVPTCFVCIY